MSKMATFALVPIILFIRLVGLFVISLTFLWTVGSITVGIMSVYHGCIPHAYHLHTVSHMPTTYMLYPHGYYHACHLVVIQ